MSFLDLPIVVNDQRQIIHVDMDAFYASVEEREHPAFRQKALVIAPDPRQHNGHGVITTANYKARQYGIGSAMPAIKALEQIPTEYLQFTDPHFDLYKQVSAQIHQIFAQVTAQWEPVAFDEAYLDVTHNNLGMCNPIQVAQWIQRRIKQDLHLTCSVGISYNKFLAKMASDYAKPFGRTVITSVQAMNFLAELPIAKFHGIGQAMQKKLAALGLETGRQLQQVPVEQLTQKLGKMGFVLYQRAHGMDDEPVHTKRQHKSISSERSFNRPVFNDQELTQILEQQAQQVATVLQQKQLRGQTVVLKVRTLEFVTYTRRKTLAHLTNDAQLIYQTSQQLFAQLALTNQPLRLLGIGVTNLTTQKFEEMTLF
ncbi:DNA polymerase IV [Bombilactobacillus folatiphilus]|uniref:DNA polymerase IV n=1 Tax=Bombilactobacillus folatiphilus TaxID=2923362 RepID=A0ABY4PAZ7_9LACO|nr:DNA polymerase IV [Bombilactobacillus folatiphilus]UQS82452.1 DNA polymerase IV [Bombilactobacillus folatiphilus]